MLPIIKDFISFALKINALQFGEFTLKSGRISPYFFNIGAFDSGHALAKLGEYYAETINQYILSFDMLYGPAYKGIPLVSATAIGLWNTGYGDKPYCFNRKEAKDHGEKGLLVGHPLTGSVLLVDDVMTAGTAFRESIEIIQKAGAQLAGVVIALDRQERGQGKHSAFDEIRQQYQVPVISICTLKDIIEYMAGDPQYSSHIEAMKAYQQSVAPIAIE